MEYKVIEPRYLHLASDTNTPAIGAAVFDQEYVPKKIKDEDLWVVSVIKDSLSEYEIAIVRKKYNAESLGRHKKGAKYIISQSSSSDWYKKPLPKQVFKMLVESAQEIADEMNRLGIR